MLGLRFSSMRNRHSDSIPLFSLVLLSLEPPENSRLKSYQFRDVTDAEFDCALLFVPVERVEVVSNEIVQLVAVVTVAQYPGGDGFSVTASFESSR